MKEDLAMADDDPKLRHEFVAIMFALAIGDVGLHTVARLQSSHRTDVAGWMHLILMTVMIAASWVGWSSARVAGARRDANMVWSRDFLVLLIDVIIVVIYFAMVK